MNGNKKLIIIPFNIPWGWSTDYLNQTAFELAKMGHEVVCFLREDKISLWKTADWNKEIKVDKKYKNLHLVRPLNILPFIRFDFIRQINNIINLVFLRLLCEYLSLKTHAKEKIFWIFDPNLLYIYDFFGGKYFLLYDCVDFFAVGSREKIGETIKNERSLCRRADLVVANSRVLQKHLYRYRKQVYLVPQGFRIDGFKVNKKKYIDLKLKHPVIGFVGGINNRLDISILMPLIKKHREWNFVLWGPVQNIDSGSDRFDQINEILALPNVTRGESKDKEEIPGLVSQFDIGIIPYDISQDFNKNCYPMKVFELFYMGKPVVSTEIVELKRFPGFVRITSNANQWEKTIKDLINKKYSAKERNYLKKVCEENSWQNKVGQIISYIK
jgi:hypothetical protein